MLALLLLIKLLQMYNNIKRVAWDYDIVLFITEQFETFRNNFKHMPADELPNVSSVWAIMYDDRRDVWIEMGGDLIIENKDTGCILQDDAFTKRIPWIVCVPLSLNDFLSLNKDYKKPLHSNNN